MNLNIANIDDKLKRIGHQNRGDAEVAQRVEVYRRAWCFRWILLLLASVPAVLIGLILRAPESTHASGAILHASVQTIDYSKFSHTNPQHARLPCLLCHKRENYVRPSLPGGGGHLPCTGCHAQQFSNSGSEICTICHADVKSGALKPFPRLQSFRMKFEHSVHKNATCATCHRPSRSGVAYSIPAGFNAHNTCYGCHNPRAQLDLGISTCGTCHQLGGYTRTPESTQAFRVGFSHGKHQRLSCTECHQLRAGMPQRRQVTSPEPLHHHASGRGQSCMTCHNGKRAFGGDDFSVCARCHTGQQWRF